MFPRNYTTFLVIPIHQQAFCGQLANVQLSVSFFKIMREGKCSFRFCLSISTRQVFPASVWATRQPKVLPGRCQIHTLSLSHNVTLFTHRSEECEMFSFNAYTVNEWYIFIVRWNSNQSWNVGLVLRWLINSWLPRCAISCLLKGKHRINTVWEQAGWLKVWSDSRADIKLTWKYIQLWRVHLGRNANANGHWEKNANREAGGHVGETEKRDFRFKVERRLVWITAVTQEMLRKELWDSCCHSHTHTLTHHFLRLPWT